MSDATLPKLPEFSFVSGRPLLNLFTKSGLSRRQSAVVVPLLAWLPLLFLSAAYGHPSRLPFLQDMAAHARLLVALPLLILGGDFLEMVMIPLPRQLVERGLIPIGGLGNLRQAVAQVMRLRNSVMMGLTLLAFVYLIGGPILWHQLVALQDNAWYIDSPAGLWYSLVSLPIFQYMLCRWYFRIFLWALFLWKISRIPLHLVPTNPDRMGGLSCLAVACGGFLLFAVAHGALLAGHLATRVLPLGRNLMDFKSEVFSILVAVLLMTMGPLMLFSPHLAAARRKGLREYGKHAALYAREFEQKWMGSHPRSPLGSPDIQSLADLANGYSVVHGMHIMPVTKMLVLQLTLATVAPVTPLLLTLMPFTDLVHKLAAILF